MNNEFKRMQKLAGFIIENTDTDSDLNKLEKMLKSHDWYFRMSDDDRSYDRGKREEDEIKQLVSTLGEEGKKLYDKYKKEANIKEGMGAYEYEKGKKAGEKIEKEKMTKSKLRDKIREMVLAEIDGAAVEAEDYDFVNEYINDPRVEEVIQMLQNMDVDGETMEHILRQVGMEDQMANQLVHNKTELGEAKKKDEEDEEDIDVEDIDIDTEMPETGGEDAEIDNIQDLLDQLQGAAEQLGDEKLLKQVGNTITFFTRQHVAEKPELNEMISSDAIDRMEGLANIQDLNILKTKLRILTTEWMDDGFDKEDVIDYIEVLINEI
jgi:hypothetical protein